MARGGADPLAGGRADGFDAAFGGPLPAPLGGRAEEVAPLGGGAARIAPSKPPLPPETPGGPLPLAGGAAPLPGGPLEGPRPAAEGGLGFATPGGPLLPLAPLAPLPAGVPIGGPPLAAIIDLFFIAFIIDGFGGKGFELFTPGGARAGRGVGLAPRGAPLAIGLGAPRPIFNAIGGPRGTLPFALPPSPSPSLNFIFIALFPAFSASLFSLFAFLKLFSL